MNTSKKRVVECRLRNSKRDFFSTFAAFRLTSSTQATTSSLVQVRRSRVRNAAKSIGAFSGIGFFGAAIVDEEAAAALAAAAAIMSEC